MSDNQHGYIPRVDAVRVLLMAAVISSLGAAGSFFIPFMCKQPQVNTMNNPKPGLFNHATAGSTI